MPWACVYTYGRSELKAVKELENQGYPVVCPMYRMPNPKDFRETIAKPLFNCYVFVHLEIDQWWTPINSTRGVIRLLTNEGGKGSTPLWLPNGEIDKWRDERTNEFSLPPGTTVRVNLRGKKANHPFNGWIGTVSELTSNDRVRVLFSIFNRDTEVIFESPNDLVKVVE